MSAATFLIILSCCLFSADLVAAEERDEKFLDELRLGVLKHDIGSGFHHRYERGYDVNGELLFVSPDNEFFNFIFSPRLHLGTSINTRGSTSQLYFGFTWRIDWLDPVFVELSFGGSGNNGRTSKRSSKREALGSNIMFREGASLGLQMSDKHSLSVMIDHTSNASLANKNPGLTGFGLRYGYKFSNT